MKRNCDLAAAMRLDDGTRQQVCPLYLAICKDVEMPWTLTQLHARRLGVGPLVVLVV